MDIGLLTTPLAEEPLEHVVAFAKAHGFGALECSAYPGDSHIDPRTMTPDRAMQIRELVSGAGLRISSLAWYENVLVPDSAARAERLKEMNALMDAAVLLGVEVICTFAGMPLPGKSRMRTIEEDFPAVFRGLAERAGEKGLKLAFENWTETNFRNLAHWERAFELVPSPNLGLNFDPSHLLWQGIDYLQAVDQFKDRIFHTHAKDTEVKQHVLRHVGNQEQGWWRYCTPGYGDVNWGVYIARLRRAGYDGVLSIEHEDDAFGRDEGFIKGQRYLSQFV